MRREFLTWFLLAFLVLLPGAPAAAQPEAEPRSLDTRLVVSVSGAVRRPGIYRLPPGTRVADAVQAAGGPLRGSGIADLDLATELRDGETVRVPPSPAPPGSFAAAVRPAAGRPGERVRPAGRAGGRSTRKAARPTPRLPATPGRSLVDVNRASAWELQRLPGVGPGLAARILAYRSRVGRLQRVEELREVPGIGEKRLARMARHVVIR